MVAAGRQLSLIGETALLAASPREEAGSYGEVFTRRWIAELILDLVGYTPDRDLGGLVLVEPSCGAGAFLVPIVDRLVSSALRHGRAIGDLSAAIAAMDLLDANAELARKAVTVRLEDAGLTIEDAERLAASWVVAGDFLLSEQLPAADFVVGNPPYLRLEAVPGDVMEAYRRSCRTMRGRSDVYVGFIERGLELLKLDGSLGYICADRWMRNSYGSALRELVTSSYAVDTVISMHDVDAFDHDVSAYPAVVVMRRGHQGEVAVAEAGKCFGEKDVDRVVSWARARSPRPIRTPHVEASMLSGWFTGSDMWPTGGPSQLAVIADLEARFRPLEDHATGTRIGIGVATGCDDVFETKDTGLVEDDRLLPLLRASDVASGETTWRGTYLVNPWDADGLVDLGCYPKMRQYFAAHASELRARHVARRRPEQWYRTIDRIDPDLLRRPKLVLPDLKAYSHPVLDEGRYYPHHNLYFVVSAVWDLEVLGGLLLSDVANMFVGAYCVRMRGGCFRFQAQYLRRIRVPDLATISKRDQRGLARAFCDRDREAATATALRLYGLSAMPPLQVKSA